MWNNNLKALFVTCLALALSLRLQAYEFIHFTKDNSGLSYDGISTITQDSRGFIWIGTYKGLNRYDGSTFNVYGKKEMGLESDFVYVVTEDADGNLWIGTDNGVTMYNYKKDRFEPLSVPGSEGSFITNKVTSIISDGTVVWMLVNDQGCFAYDTATGYLKEFPYSKIGLSGFRKILKGDDGGFWISRYHSNLYRADSTFMKVLPVNFSDKPGFFIGDEIEGLFHSGDGKLVVASANNWLTEVNPETSTVRTLMSLPENTLLQNAFIDTSGNIWLSTSAGVWRYALSTGKTECIRNNRKDVFSISNDYTTCTFVDRDGGLWIGTKDMGVNYSGSYQNNFEKQYMIDGEPMTGVLVSGFAEDAKGNIWVATEEKGLLVYDPRTHRTERLAKQGIPSRICSICRDGNRIWFGTRQGLYCIDSETLELRRYGMLEKPQGISDPNVYMIFRTVSGDMLFGTTLGIFRYDREADDFVSIPIFDGIFPTCAAEDPAEKGVIWISTYANGVYRWDSNAGDKLVNYTSSSGSGLKNDKIASVFIDKSSRVWAVGFSIGLACFDSSDGTFDIFDRQNVPVLGSDVFFKAVEDSKGRMWLASDNGLVEFDPDSGGGYVYTLTDGLLDLKFTNSAFRSSSGDMYFGSDNGFVRFNPETLPISPSPPSIVLSSMKIGDEEAHFGENIDLVSEIVLEHDRNSFGFNFSLLGLSAPMSSHVQCRLKGYSDEWNDIVAKKSVFYYNVPPGQYHLQVRVISEGTEWIEARPPLKIVVKPGFWASFPGTVIIVLLILGVIAFSIWLSHRQYRKIKEEEQKEYQKAKDEETFMEKMNFFSHVIHEIKTPLTLIQTPLNDILSKPVDKDTMHDLIVMQNSTQYLSRLVNELLDYVRIERAGYTLKCQDIDIIDRLNSSLFSFSDTARNKNIRIETRYSLSSAVVYADSAALDKILNNLLLNAVKYAGTFILIEVKESGHDVRISFTNDGTPIPPEFREEIFKPFVQFRGARQSSEGVGIGLPLSRKLARMHSGDLILEDDPVLTVFVLTLPVKSLDDTAEDEISDMQDPDSAGKPCILIADDNKDFREYLSSKLEKNYDTVTVGTADAAFDILKEKDIDLVLTDISMPGKSGLQLCRSIREDIEVSHVPVIVISARASMESKIEAMQAGADLYIEKPFDMQYLMSSIRNILERRSLLRNTFGKGTVRTDIDMFGLPKKDEEFFAMFDSFVRNNLSNPELSNEFLADHLNMSQSTLSRKIRKLLNTSPNNYIRSTRIAVAAEMLKDSHGNNITEICYSVGFSNVSYFTKCFKEQYGMTPTEMQRKK